MFFFFWAAPALVSFGTIDPIYWVDNTNTYMRDNFGNRIVFTNTE